MALANLVEKVADSDLLRDMIQYVAQRVMELDTEGVCAAGYGERSLERANSRVQLQGEGDLPELPRALPGRWSCVRSSGKLAWVEAPLGAANGGGQELRFKTFHGDITIRKRK